MFWGELCPGGRCAGTMNVRDITRHAAYDPQQPSANGFDQRKRVGSRRTAATQTLPSDTVMRRPPAAEAGEPRAL